MLVLDDVLVLVRVRFPLVAIRAGKVVRAPFGQHAFQFGHGVHVVFGIGFQSDGRQPVFQPGDHRPFAFFVAGVVKIDLVIIEVGQRVHRAFLQFVARRVRQFRRVLVFDHVMVLVGVGFPFVAFGFVKVVRASFGDDGRVEFIFVRRKHFQQRIFGRTTATLQHGVQFRLDGFGLFAPPRGRVGQKVRDHGLGGIQPVVVVDVVQIHHRLQIRFGRIVGRVPILADFPGDFGQRTSGGPFFQHGHFGVEGPCGGFELVPVKVVHFLPLLGVFFRHVLGRVGGHAFFKTGQLGKCHQVFVGLHGF